MVHTMEHLIENAFGVRSGPVPCKELEGCAGKVAGGSEHILLFATTYNSSSGGI